VREPVSPAEAAVFIPILGCWYSVRMADYEERRFGRHLRPDIPRGRLLAVARRPSWRAESAAGLLAITVAVAIGVGL
jgi:hypothetical protein